MVQPALRKGVRGVMGDEGILLCLNSWGHTGGLGQKQTIKAGERDEERETFRARYI